MRIEAKDIARAFGRQTRAYAEYRTFSSLAPFGDVVRGAVVSLTPAANGSWVTCLVTVDLQMSAPVHIMVRGRHAYDAINRAAERLGVALSRQTQTALSS